MTPSKETCSATRWMVGQWATIAFVLFWVACGMKTGLLEPSVDAGHGVDFLGGSVGEGGAVASGNGGHTSIGSALGGSSTVSHGGSGGTGLGGSATTSYGGSGGTGLGGIGGNGFAGNTAFQRGGNGGNGFAGNTAFPRGGNGGGAGTGGTTAVFRDAAVAPDVRVVADAMPGSPTIDPNSGYATVPAGTVVMSGFVTSSAGGSGSSISLTCNKDSFCASGTVGASTTYNSWANTGFNVNQKQSGGSGSTGSLALVGSTMSISYVNRAGSTLELQLWDSVGSSYWCYFLPPSTSPTTTTFALSRLNSKCWDGSGASFVSGTSITMVQLVVPGSATSITPFDYCFLGLTVQ